MMARPGTRVLAVAVVAGLSSHSHPSLAADESGMPGAACRARADYRRLDFWLGHWGVYEGEKFSGINTIEPVVSGCAVLESWVERDGHVGSSWFYFDPILALWKQVWITDQAWRLGGTKEKTEAPGTREGHIRFQGVLVDAQGKRTLDRTTLDRNPDGTVRQLIEWSVDEGASWRAVFDARYAPRSTDRYPR